MGVRHINFDPLIHKIKENNWEVHGMEVYYIGHGGKSAGSDKPCSGQERIYVYGDVTAHRYPIYSATKTITSLAVGMAADEGKMDIGRSVLAYIPEKILSALPEEAKERYQKVTIKRLLTMSVPGFPFRPEGESWLRNSLQYPVEPEKTVFDYSNVSAYLAGVAAANALEEDLYAYLQRQLFQPLGIENPPFQRCPDGYFYGASGMELTVNELSRIGFVLMDEGLYQGTRILSEKYVKEACGIQQMNREGGYGYFVWKYQDGFRISGKWGQRCYIFPRRGLMVTYLAHMEEGSEQLADCMWEMIADLRTGSLQLSEYR